MACCTEQPGRRSGSDLATQVSASSYFRRMFFLAPVLDQVGRGFAKNAHSQARTLHGDVGVSLIHQPRLGKEATNRFKSLWKVCEKMPTMKLIVNI